MALQVPIASKLVVLVKLRQLSGIRSDIEKVVGGGWCGDNHLYGEVAIAGNRGGEDFAGITFVILTDYFAEGIVALKF